MDFGFFHDPRLEKLGAKAVVKSEVKTAASTSGIPDAVQVRKTVTRVAPAPSRPSPLPPTSASSSRQGSALSNAGSRSNSGVASPKPKATPARRERWSHSKQADVVRGGKKRKSDSRGPESLLKAKLKSGTMSAASTPRSASSPPSTSSPSDSDSGAESTKANKRRKVVNGSQRGSGTPVSAGRAASVDQEGNMHATTPYQKRIERYIPLDVAYTRDPASIDVKDDSKSTISEIMQSFDLVTLNRGAYKQWFRDPASEDGSFPAEGGDPVVEVEYPGEGEDGTGGREKFVLVVPRIDDDEYRPIDDLMNVIRTILGHFLTAEQCQTHFSETHPISSASTGASSAFSFLSAPSKSSSLPPRSSRSPSLAPPAFASSRGTTPMTHLTVPGASSSAGHSPVRDASSPAVPIPDESPDGPPDLSHIPLISGLDKARRRQDGPRFVALIGHFNRVIALLRSSGALRSNISSLPGLRLQIWDTVLRQSYERRVGPHVDALRNYESWSDNVYGELRPQFVSDILHLTHVGPSDVVIDLGSGVGNCVVQAALESGCTAVGFENMPTASKLAALQKSEVSARAKFLWGVTVGDAHVFEADFTADPRVGDWLRKADVILVNNQVFTPALNEKLSLLFLDLKDGTRVVSLKPFVPGDFRLTGRTADSPHAVLDQGPQRRYARNSVSWTGEGGTFYIAKVDRSRVEKYLGGLGR